MTSILRFAKDVGQLLSLITALALTTVCAGPMADLKHAQTSAYVFHHSAPDVEAAARQLLKDRGFEVLAANGTGIVRTEWHAVLDDQQFATEYERYIIGVQRLTHEHCRIAALKISLATLGMETAHPHSVGNGKDTNNNTASYGAGTSPLLVGAPTVRRDLDIEWSLIAYEEPDRARDVQSRIAWLSAHH